MDTETSDGRLIPEVAIYRDGREVARVPETIAWLHFPPEARYDHRQTGRTIRIIDPFGTSQEQPNA